MKIIILSSILILFLLGILSSHHIFAEKEIMINIEPIEKRYPQGDPIFLKINVEKYVPNTPIYCSSENPNGYSFNGGQKYLEKNELTLNYRLSSENVIMLKSDGSPHFRDAVNVWRSMVGTTHTIICYYGLPDNYLGNSSLELFFHNKFNPAVEYVLQNHIVDKFDVGTDVINDMYIVYNDNCPSNFCITYSVIDSNRRQDITIYYYNPPQEEYVGKKIIENVSVDLGWGSVFDGCDENYPNHCLVFNTLVDKIKKNGFPSKFEEEPSLTSLTQFTKSFTDVESKPIICGIGTMLKDGQCIVDTNYKIPEPTSEGGGCLIATATYGSEMAIEVQQLRELRDNSLLQTKSGTQFMNSFNDVYYSFSPIIADYERENPLFKEMVKLFITPMISSLSILNYVEMNSESEVLGYGISLILLNIGMYLGVPAVVIIGIRKRT